MMVRCWESGVCTQCGGGVRVSQANTEDTHTQRVRLPCSTNLKSKTKTNTNHIEDAHTRARLPTLIWSKVRLTSVIQAYFNLITTADRFQKDITTGRWPEVDKNNQKQYRLWGLLTVAKILSNCPNIASQLELLDNFLPCFKTFAPGQTLHKLYCHDEWFLKPTFYDEHLQRKLFSCSDKVCWSALLRLLWLTAKPCLFCLRRSLYLGVSFTTTFNKDKIWPRMSRDFSKIRTHYTTHQTLLSVFLFAMPYYSPLTRLYLCLGGILFKFHYGGGGTGVAPGRESWW